MDQNILSVTRLSRSFKSNDRIVKALNDLSFSVNEGESVLITGESGSGKTTLLKLIGMLDKPTSGGIIINGKDISKMDEQSRTEFRRKNIGIIFQKYHLLPYLTARENVSIPMLLDGWTLKDALNKSDELLNDVGLLSKKDEYVAVLSGGEAQRVAIARAISLNPKIILADEPTGNLDKITEEKILNYILDYQKKNNKTVILVSHNNELSERMDKHINIERGTD